MQPGGTLTGAGGRGRVGGRARVVVLAHAERGGAFRGPAVFRARRTERPPGGHLVKPWGTGCGEGPVSRGLLHNSPPLSCLSPSGWGLYPLIVIGKDGGLSSSSVNNLVSPLGEMTCFTSTNSFDPHNL